MKKFLLTIFVFSAFGLCAQNSIKPGDILSENSSSQNSELSLPASDILTTKLTENQSFGLKNVDFVNPVAIGQSANAFGFAYYRTTFLWAVNEINSISFVHRSDNNPGSGWVSYDLSTDGGNTWSTNNQVYDPTLPDAFPVRYPQGVIYNPAGNTDPDQAYFSYFAPTVDASNGSTWGGYCFGTKGLAEEALPTQNNLPSSNDFYQFIPSGFTVTQLGETWVVDMEIQYDASGSSTYTDKLIVGHGTWNDGSKEFDYLFDHMEMEADEVYDVKVAFAPDGMTGWICAIANRGEQSLPLTLHQTILYKTTDGGQNWSDPMHIQLGGVDGLDNVTDFISDEALIDFYAPDPVPDRNDIPYSMDYYFDMSVDAWGNPHIFSSIAICDLEDMEVFKYDGVFAMFHIYSNNQGETWESFVIDYPERYSATFSGNNGSIISMFNRPQVSTTQDGAIVFFSYLDTRVEGIEDNSLPDIYFREYIPEMNIHGEEVINVTHLSTAMWNARWGCMSHYVFSDVSDNGTYECTIPFVYQQVPTNISEPVQFWYIPDFQRSYTVTGINESMDKPLVTLAQNYPNPFSETTHFNINLLKRSDVNIHVFNLSGQMIKQFAYSQLPNGPHQLTLNFENIKSGIYFYELIAGDSKYTGKMIIK